MAFWLCFELQIRGLIQLEKKNPHENQQIIPHKLTVKMLQYNMPEKVVGASLPFKLDFCEDFHEDFFPIESDPRSIIWSLHQKRSIEILLSLPTHGSSFSQSCLAWQSRGLCPPAFWWPIWRDGLSCLWRHISLCLHWSYIIHTSKEALQKTSLGKHFWASWQTSSARAS